MTLPFERARLSRLGRWNRVIVTTDVDPFNGTLIHVGGNLSWRQHEARARRERLYVFHCWFKCNIVFVVSSQDGQNQFYVVTRAVAPRAN